MLRQHSWPPLDPAEVRCRPLEAPCEMQQTCLRFRAPMPSINAARFDGMIERRDPLGNLSPSCLHYLPLPPAEGLP